MLKQTDAFNQAFASDSRTLNIKATVAGKSYDADDLLTVEYDSAALTGEQMGLGSTYENSVKISFANLIEGIQAKDTVTVEVGIMLPDGTYEYASLGEFFVTDEIEMDRNNNLTTITADDGMCKLEGTYTPKVTAPVTMANMVTDIANQAGVTMNTDNISKLPVISIDKLPNNQTYRTVLGWLAMMIPGYATFDRSGKLCLKGITNSTYAVTPDNYEFQGLTKNENPYTLGGITVTQNSVTVDDTSTMADDATDDSDTTTDGSDTTTDATDDTSDTTDDTDTVDTDDSDKSLHIGETTGSQLEVQNDLMNEAVLADVWNAVKGIQYYPYTLNWFGNPAVEAGDWLKISDTKGNEFTVPNSSYVMTFDGGFSAVSSTAETVVSSTDWNYSGTLAQTIKQVVERYNTSGTYTYDSVSDPINPHEGDLWYKPNGDLTELYIYKNGAWQLMVSDVTGKNIEDEVKKAQDSVVEARAVADAANKQASDNKNALQLKVGTDEYNSEISELTNDISLRVKRDDLISTINLEAGQTLIQSGKILLDAPTVTFSGKAFIPSAAITDLEASKLTAGTIDANQINIINMNGNNISAGTITADKLAVDAVQVGINSLGDTIKVDNESLNFYNAGSKQLSLDKQGLNVYANGTLIGEILGHTWSGYEDSTVLGMSEKTTDIGLSFRLENVDGAFMSWERYDATAKKYLPKFYWLSDPFKGVDPNLLAWVGLTPDESTFFFTDSVWIDGKDFIGGGFQSTTDSSITGTRSKIQLDVDGPGISIASAQGSRLGMNGDVVRIISQEDIIFSRDNDENYDVHLDQKTGITTGGISIFDLADRVKDLEDTVNAN